MPRQNYRLLNQLDDAFKRAVDDPAVSVIVLGGKGKHFSAGHDLGTPEKDRHLERERKLLWYDHRDLPGAESLYVLEQDAYLGFCRRWQELPKPPTALVQGACGAGGAWRQSEIKQARHEASAWKVPVSGSARSRQPAISRVPSSAR